MPTPFPEQEKLAPQIVKLFGAFPSEYIYDEEDFSKLRSAIDSAVHFYFYLTEVMQTPIDPYGEETEYRLFDLTVWMEFFWRVRENIRDLLQARGKVFQWTVVASPEELKTKFFASYEKLTDKETPLEDRYYHLMLLTQLQLIFLSTVWV